TVAEASHAAPQKTLTTRKVAGLRPAFLDHSQGGPPGTEFGPSGSQERKSATDAFPGSQSPLPNRSSIAGSSEGRLGGTGNNSGIFSEGGRASVVGPVGIGPPRLLSKGEGSIGFAPASSGVSSGMNPDGRLPQVAGRAGSGPLGSLPGGEGSSAS